ncbi:hypothetical protein FAIPA1_80017 [Frankia sp. AiPs1]
MIRAVNRYSGRGSPGSCLIVYWPYVATSVGLAKRELTCWDTLVILLVGPACPAAAVGAAQPVQPPMTLR